tara:strand:+ start:473 stop:631 length:159 start_codon:yes stop_codon:yes gene_type:complete
MHLHVRAFKIKLKRNNETTKQRKDGEHGAIILTSFLVRGTKLKRNFLKSALN